MESLDFKIIEPILKENHVKYAGIFGSRARGDARPDSDIDILVKFLSPKSLLQVIHLQNILSDLFDKKVDLLTEGGVHPAIRPHIMNDLKIVYGER